jgi:mannose-6-phosphate isomerase
LTPIKLQERRLEKPWGATKLQPWFSDSAKKIGEVWFESEEPLPILVKFLFTSENLSVQVHPDDNYAGEHENSPGKTEMWYILRAEPEARIALGFRERVTASRVRAAIGDGSIEHLLRWHAVRAGDCFFTPAGTVHSIGAGIALCEIQQQSDVTYRLYDYGRQPARSLHIEQALAVANLGPHPGPQAPPHISNGGRLAHCRYFATELLHWAEPFEYVPDHRCSHLLIVTEGAGRLGGEPFRLGQTWQARAAKGAFHVAPDGPVTVLRTYVPPETD